MSDDTQATPTGDSLRQEAADWFSLMRGPDADKRRDEFDRWLASSAAHRRAYNSISEKFNLGKGLKGKSAPVPADRRSTSQASGVSVPGHPNRGKHAALACGVAALCLAAGYQMLEQHPVLPDAKRSQLARDDREARFATTVGEIRNFVLLDGSKLTLDTQSIVLASYTRGERGLRLLQGRARFAVAKDARPFVVRADTTVVTAHGATFDMRLEMNRRVGVHPLQGEVEVQSQGDSGVPGPAEPQPVEPLLTRLAKGQRLLVDGQQVSMAIKGMQNDDQWPEGVEAFNDVALSELVASLNRYAKKPVVITEAQIGAMRISGTYRLLETGATIRKVGTLLGLVVTEDTKAYRLHRN